MYHLKAATVDNATWIQFTNFVHFSKIFVNRRDVTFPSLGCQAGGRGTDCSSEAGEYFLHAPVTWDKERGKERIIKLCIMKYSKGLKDVCC